MLPNADQRPIVPMNDYIAIVSDDPNHFAGFNLSDGSVSVLSQSVSADGASINYQINVSTGTPRTEAITFSIQNTSGYSMTNGTFAYTVSGAATGVVNGTITAAVPQTIGIMEIRNYNNKYTF